MLALALVVAACAWLSILALALALCVAAQRGERETGGVAAQRRRPARAHAARGEYVGVGRLDRDAA